MQSLRLTNMPLISVAQDQTFLFESIRNQDSTETRNRHYI